MCAALGLSASGYYAWRARPESARAAANRALLDDIRRIHADSSGTYGSPRVHAVLRGHGRRVGRSRIERLMRPSLHVEIALDALEMAIQRQRPAPGLIHHSDRGIQYAAEAYRSALAQAGVTPSMSRKGDCWDNAPMESFFHTLKTERIHHRVYATRDQARRDLFQYIEGFYNPRRLHSALGYISPADAERRAA